MTRILLPAFLLILAACATPVERCVNQAEKPYRQALAEDRELAETLARGYEIRSVRVPFQKFTRCENSKGTVYPCWRTYYRWVDRRVRVDLDEVRARKAEIAARLPSLQAAASAGSAQCRAAYPDG